MTAAPRTGDRLPEHVALETYAVLSRDARARSTYERLGVDVPGV